MAALTACAGDDAATTAGSTPAASTAPSAASSAAVAAPATTSTAPSAASPSAAAGGTSDKELCTAAKKAGDDMKQDLITALQSGADPSPALFKKIFTEMSKEMATLSAAGGDGEVASAMKKFGVEAANAAKAADPADDAGNPAFEKAGAAVTAACEPTGVNVNF